ncbi:MAG: hypothetical protein IKW20_05915 [Bacteroidales bacterium]|nr:hypothetical protein [Bacteroidales bacterium]
MTQAEKLQLLKAMVGESDTEEVLLAYLNIAGSKIINRAYPYDSEVTEVPTRYEFLQCEIAAYLLNKRGAEGQLIHSENGISRSYGSADVPSAMLDAITPVVGVI